MLLTDLVTSFYDVIDMFEDHDKLASSIWAICQHVGFTHFAIAHHDILKQEKNNLIRLHNYPDDLVDYHDAHELGVRDPVHRASQIRGAGFTWSRLPDLLPLTQEDRRILEMARRAGIGDGYTVPYHLPGERSGSSSFAVGPGRMFPRHAIPLAQSLGAFAFEAARKLQGRSSARARVTAGWLTERERQIVVWLGHGKQEKEIARLLGIAPSTVNDHLANARARFGVRKSSLLVICGLLCGSISYSELLLP